MTNLFGLAGKASAAMAGPAAHRARAYSSTAAKGGAFMLSPSFPGFQGLLERHRMGGGREGGRQVAGARRGSRRGRALPGSEQAARAIVGMIGGLAQRERSEEHTSELQS